MKTKHRAATRRYLLLLLLVPPLILMATACGSYNSSGGGGGGNAPYISGLSASSGAAGTPVTVTGNYFGATQGSSTVTFNGTAATPTSWSNTSIVVPVPPGATSGPVVVTVGGKASNAVTFTVTTASGPTITSLSPTSGAVGASVTITGTNFGSTQGSSTVLFYNRIAATPTSWSATSIVVTVPSGATTGNIVVTVGGVASNGVNFTVTSSSSNAGWTFVQDNPIFFCQGPNRSGCSGGLFFGNMTATVSGSVWVLYVQGPCGDTVGGSNPTNCISTSTPISITSVTGGSGTWVHCSSCRTMNTNHGYSVDAWYNLSGNAGEDGSHLAFTLAANSGYFISVTFVEILPPAGSTASFDTAGTATPTNCSGTSATPCTAVPLTLTATDAVLENVGGAGHAAWNSWSAPFITTQDSAGIALNVPAGNMAAPTTAFRPCGSSPTFTTCNPEFFAIAFKSSLGNFTPPTQQYSIKQITTAQGTAGASGSGLNCGAGCTVSLPQATTAGDLLYIQGNSGQGGFISAVACAPVACNSGSSAAVVPTGNSNSVCQRSWSAVPGVTNASLSCAYILSVPGGVTSLTVTATNSLALTVSVVEVASTVGSFVLDAQGSTQVTAFINPPGQALTLTGTNDVIFGAFWVNGGGNLTSYFPYPYLGWYCTGTGGNTSPCNAGNYTDFNLAEMAVLLDSGPTQPSYLWVNPQGSGSSAQNVIVTGMAFKTQ